MADVTDAHGQELTNSGGGKTLYTGGKFTPNENIYLISALKNTYCDADTAYLLNAAMEVIDSQAFVGDIATFTNSNLLTNGTEYSLAIKNSDDGEFTYRAGAAAAGVPIAKTNITYTHGIDAGGEATYFVNLVSITTNVDDTEYIGIIATSEQIDLMCGENVNTIGNKNSNKNDLMAQVQAYLSNLVKYDIATNWASLNSVYRQSGS